MPTAYPEFFAALAAPFDPQEVKFRTQAGRQFQYVTARTVQNRLDNVAGPEGWWDDFVPGEHSVLCRLTIRLPDGSTLTKCDAGGYAGMTDQGDDDKSGYSDAFKRAAVKFGIGRYLYRDGVPHFFDGEVPSEPQHTATNQEAKWGHQRAERPPVEQSQLPHDGNGGGQPRTGKSLYAWAAGEDKKDESLHLVKALNAWGKSEGLPFKMIDWQPADVTRAFEAAQAHFRAFYGGGSGDE
jgi:hypothetical protein